MDGPGTGVLPLCPPPRANDGAGRPSFIRGAQALKGLLCLCDPTPTSPL